MSIAESATDSNIVLTLGPPGCGKTTALADSARKAVHRYQDNKALVIVSLTNTAAHEIASRQLPVAKNQVGTLHAICYRQLDRPQLAHTHLKEWNAEHPHLRMASTTWIALPDDDTGEHVAQRDAGGHADAFAEQYELLRHRMVDRALWPQHIQNFAKAWEDWKTGNGLIDYTDMIERCYLNFEGAPFGAKLLMGDEAQDWSRLEFAQFLKWAHACDYAMLAADDDQQIFSWRGADAANLIDLNPRETRILSQSYRLPPAVHAYCQQWVHRISHRLEKEYYPRTDSDGGEVRHLGGDWKQPTGLLRLCEAADKAGKSLMILTACSYQLAPLLKKFKAQGIPFANPYRPRKAAWNPLSRAQKGVSTVDRVLAFLAPQQDPDGRLTWTWEELQCWVPLVQVPHVLQRNAKTQIKSDESPVEAGVPLPLAYLTTLFLPDALEALLAGDFVWLWAHAIASQKDRLRYFSEVLIQDGVEGLAVPEARPAPGVPVVGTIHAAKGGEADWVYVFPDLSGGGYKSWTGKVEQRDTVLRQFYVAISRAKEKLFLGGSGKQAAVNW